MNRDRQQQHAHAALPTHPPLEERVGVVHVHSTYSDGTGGMERILAAAHAAEADFVILTDHDNVAARREGWERMHDGVALLVAPEITPRSGPHCLVLGVQDSLGFARLPQREYLERVARAGGFVAVAHPLGKHRPELGMIQKAWTSWRHPAIGAVEIWNYMHNWIARVHAWKAQDFYRLLRHPQLEVGPPEPRVLANWDRVARQRRLAGISGLDCHAKRMPLTDFEIFGYEDMFLTLRTHVLPAPGPNAPEKLLTAIRQARCFVANDFLADSRGTRFWAECGCGRTVLLGEQHCCGDEFLLRLALPRPARIRIIHDGDLAAEARSDRFEAPFRQPGVYRAEAYLDEGPWLFTNHLYLVSYETDSPAGAPHGARPAD